VIDLEALAVTAEMPARLGASSLAVDAGRERLWCANFMDHTVTIVDTAADRVLRHLAVGAFPCKVAAHPGSGRGYVAYSHSGAIGVLDLHRPSLLGEISVPGAPVGVSLSASGERLYVADRSAGALGVVDLASGTEWARVAVGAGPGDVIVDPGSDLVSCPTPVTGPSPCSETASLALRPHRRRPALPLTTWSAGGSRPSPCRR